MTEHQPHKTIKTGPGASQSNDHTFDLTLDLSDLLDVDIDGLNDLACEAFGSHELQDISYKVFGLKGEQIIIQVSGWIA